MVDVYDPNDMIGETSQIVNDLDIATNQVLNLPKIDFDTILICGMGGSAAGGDVVCDCLYRVSDKLVKVIRFPELPVWAGDKTLVIVSSYSGNTAETLSIYEQAIKRGCPIVAMTSGGKLLESANADNVPVVLLKTGIQPRNAMGYTVGFLLNIIRTVGGPDINKDVVACIPELRKYVKSLKSEDSEAHKIASHIHGSIPAIYSTAYLKSVAGRWRSQLNENSKIVAFDGNIPDTNHSDIAGLTGTGQIPVKPILLIEDGMPKMMKEITALTNSILKHKGLNPYVVRISGKSTFERIFRATLLGDFISLNLAFINEKDPCEVNSIKKLKLLLSKKLSGRKTKESTKKSAKKSSKKSEKKSSKKSTKKSTDKE